jgi:hypothetical protein
MIFSKIMPAVVGHDAVEIDNGCLRFGYTVRIAMALDIRRYNGMVDSFDHGRSSDFRISDFTVVVDSDKVSELESFLNFRRAYTGENFYISGLTGSGFYPAGPDIGQDSYSVTLMQDVDFSSMRIDQFGFYNIKLKLLFRDLPASVSHETISGGWDFEFGDVKGLRDPGISPSRNNAAVRSASIGGKPSIVKRETDEYTTTLALNDTTDKMSALIPYIQSIRGQTFKISGSKNFRPFGGAIDDGTMPISVRLLSNTLTVTHATWDTWTTSIQLWRAEGMHL